MFCQNNILNRKIAELGKQYGLNAEESYEIMRHEFKMIADTFAQFELDNTSTHKSIRVMHIGKFQCKRSIAKLIKKRKEDGQ